MEAPQDKNSLEAIGAAVGGILLVLVGLWRWAIGRSPNGMSRENKAILEELKEIKTLQHSLEELVQTHSIRIAVIETKLEKP